MEIKDKVAVITGGGSGMGSATVRLLAEQGAKVSILDWKEGDAVKFVEEFGEDNVMFTQTNVADTEHIRKAIERTMEKWGRIDICGAIAGVMIGEKIAHPKKGAHSMESFRRVLGIDLFGVFDVNRQCAYYMKNNEPDENGDRGVIVNVSSGAAFVPAKGQSAYGSSKGAVLMMTRALAEELKEDGIRAFVVAPGAFRTPLFDSVGDNVKDGIEDNLKQYFPRRWAIPEEFALMFRQIVENPCWSGGEALYHCNGQNPCTQYR